MSLPSQLDGLQEVRGVLAVDPSGQLLEARPGTPDATPDAAATVAVALGGLATAGGTAGRPGPAVPEVANLFVAGDWVGPEAMLADASFASARQAAALVLAETGMVTPRAA